MALTFWATKTLGRRRLFHTLVPSQNIDMAEIARNLGYCRASWLFLALVSELVNYVTGWCSLESCIRIGDSKDLARSR